jgi:hypothetical protein
MAFTQITLKQRGFGETMRRDAWWARSVVVFTLLSLFIIYSTWAAFQNAHYWFEGGGAHYLSPFYSPEIFGVSPHSIFGNLPAWFPKWIPFSPALLILWAPGGFRFTCYYYRGAYYKAFWADPPNCAVGEPRGGYRGERKFPLVMQNVHRLFLYIALIFLLFLAHDAWQAMWFADGFGIGVGTLVLTLNVVFLGSYTLSCHSLRHLVGGRLDEMSAQPACLKAYQCVSQLNAKHMIFAWVSLLWVAFSDLYVRLCSMGVWHDFRII